MGEQSGKKKISLGILRVQMSPQDLPLASWTDWGERALPPAVPTPPFASCPGDPGDTAQQLRSVSPDALLAPAPRDAFRTFSLVLPQQMTLFSLPS